MAKSTGLKVKFNDFKYKWKTEKSTENAMSTKEVWSYGLTEFGRNSGEVLITGYLNVFLTMALGIDPMPIAVMTSVASIIGIVQGPFISLFLDITNTKWGRFRPYLILSAPLMAILAIAFLINPFPAGDETQLVYVYITYISWGFISAILNTAWSGMKNCFTRNDEEKGRCFAIARGMNVISGLLPSSLPILIDVWNKFGWSIRGLFVGIALIGGVLSLCASLFARNLRERILIPKREKIFKNIKMVFKNKYQMILWLNSISGIFMKLNNMAGPFVFIYCYGAYSWQTVSWGITGVAAWAGLLLSKRLMKIFTPKTMIYAHNLLNAGANLAIFFIGYGVGLQNVLPLLILKGFAGIFEYVSTGVAEPMIQTNIWDHYEWKYGIRNESTTGLIGGYVTLPITVLTNMVYGWVFTAIGFESGAAAQTPETTSALFAVFTLGGVAWYLLTCVPYIFINLNKETMAKVKAELEERKRQKNVALRTRKDDLNTELNAYNVYGEAEKPEVEKEL